MAKQTIVARLRGWAQRVRLRDNPAARAAWAPASAATNPQDNETGQRIQE